VWGSPLYVPPSLSKTEAAGYQTLLADRLDGVTDTADRLARCPAAGT
jgi:hypothetical protein